MLSYLWLFPIFQLLLVQYLIGVTNSGECYILDHNVLRFRQEHNAIGSRTKLRPCAVVYMLGLGAMCHCLRASLDPWVVVRIWCVGSRVVSIRDCQPHGPGTILWSGGLQEVRFLCTHPWLGAQYNRRSSVPREPSMGTLKIPGRLRRTPGPHN